jgi:RimJ/RimL family protein N-acetyltransferase
VELRPPDPDLSDDSVVLRPLRPADIPNVVAACRDPEIVRWTTEIAEGYTEEHARNWIESTHAGWTKGRAELAIAEKATDAFAGAIGLFARQEWVAEIGYWIAPASRGRGLATRALELISAWAEELGFVRLQLTILPGNHSSERVAAKAGYAEEGVLRAWVNQRGTIKDASMWSRVQR